MFVVCKDKHLSTGGCFWQTPPKDLLTISRYHPHRNQQSHLPVALMHPRPRHQERHAIVKTKIPTGMHTRCMSHSGSAWLPVEPVETDHFCRTMSHEPFDVHGYHMTYASIHASFLNEKQNNHQVFYFMFWEEDNLVLLFLTRMCSLTDNLIAFFPIVPGLQLVGVLGGGGGSSSVRNEESRELDYLQE